MPTPILNKDTQEYQSEMQEIISAPPPWLIRRGMTVIFLIVLMIIGLSVLIQYPDVIKLPLRISSTNPSITVVSKVSGRVIKLLAGKGALVKKGAALAYLENPANHDVVLQTLSGLKQLQEEILSGELKETDIFNLAQLNELGELQGSFTGFYRQYIGYLSHNSDGPIKKKNTYPDQESNLSFLQALNTEIGEFESWKSKYVLVALQDGQLAHVRAIQEDQYVRANEPLFYTDPGNVQFFAEMAVPQATIGKVKIGQEVLIKLRSFPFQEFGILRGRISTLSEIPVKDSAFISTVSFDLNSRGGLSKSVRLKADLIADAEIIMQHTSLFSRMLKGLIKTRN
jgi:multidrug efflux pump subunit AcrA (membrane-fusion protein)